MQMTQSMQDRCRYTKSEILEKVGRVTLWGQTIPLPYGVTTPGRVMHNLTTLRRLALPDDLSGRRVLDVGAWDGYYSFECEKRGAEVVAIDNLYRMQKSGEVEHAHLGNQGFETARDILDSKVVFRNMDVCDVNKKDLGVFDIVLFLGVLYHLKNPLAALERIAEVTRGQVIIETEWMRTPFLRRPVVQYVEKGSLNQDPTNHCRPNTRWLFCVLKDLGFGRVEVVHKARIGVHAIVNAVTRADMGINGRIIVKAHR